MAMTEVIETLVEELHILPKNVAHATSPKSVPMLLVSLLQSAWEQDPQDTLWADALTTLLQLQADMLASPHLRPTAPQCDAGARAAAQIRDRFAAASTDEARSAAGPSEDAGSVSVSHEDARSVTAAHEEDVQEATDAGRPDTKAEEEPAPAEEGAPDPPAGPAGAPATYAEMAQRWSSGEPLPAPVLAELAAAAVGELAPAMAAVMSCKLKERLLKTVFARPDGAAGAGVPAEAEARLQQVQAQKQAATAHLEHAKQRLAEVTLATSRAISGRLAEDRAAYEGALGALGEEEPGLLEEIAAVAETFRAVRPLGVGTEVQIRVSGAPVRAKVVRVVSPVSYDLLPSLGPDPEEDLTSPPMNLARSEIDANTKQLQVRECAGGASRG